MTPPAFAPIKAKAGRRSPVPILGDIQAMVRHFAQELIEQHGDAFHDPNLKTRVAAMLRRCLPPRRRPGRPGIPSVSAAVRLHDELKQSFPTRPAKEIWREVYRAIIPGWDALRSIERRAEADQLHRRVRWRIRAAQIRSRRTRSSGKAEE